MAMPNETAKRRTIALDTMGGDRGAAEVVRAVELALKQYEDIEEIILCGPKRMLEKMLSMRHLNNDPRLTIHHASEVVTMKDKPMHVLRHKKDSSMLRAIELVKEGRAGAVVSLGNTGALMGAATLKLRPVAGIERPALATVIPSYKHHFLLIDAGANPETSAIQLVHNAILGNIYYKSILPNKQPRVGLLTIGTEEGKGTERVNEANALLRQLGDRINYVGLMEGFDVFQNVADVVVTDGFAGNILLKGVQSIFHALKHTVGEEIRANPIRKLGYLLVRGAFKGVTARFGPADYAGAPMLGLNGLVFKTHGSSNHEYIRGALRIARESQAHALVETTSEAIASALEALKVPSPLAAAAV